MIFTIAILAGILLGLLTPYDLPPAVSQYVAIGLVAALDTIFGGLFANARKCFDTATFFTGFFTNSILAVAFVYAGSRIGVNLNFAVQVIFGVRIFNNLSAMRRLLLLNLRR